jgi:hypothetical protein
MCCGGELDSPAVYHSFGHSTISACWLCVKAVPFRCGAAANIHPFGNFVGDGEGGNEMTYSLGYLRQFCRIFQDQAASTRIYFPDQKVRHRLSDF